jgi:hypothetical protein
LHVRPLATLSDYPQGGAYFEKTPLDKALSKLSTVFLYQNKFQADLKVQILTKIDLQLFLIPVLNFIIVKSFIPTHF